MQDDPIYGDMLNQSILNKQQMLSYSARDRLKAEIRLTD